MGYLVSATDRFCDHGHDLTVTGKYKRPAGKFMCKRCHLDGLARARERLGDIRDYKYQLVTEREFRNFWRKVDKSGANGCWVWTAATMLASPSFPHEYGVIQVACRSQLAHRVSYALIHGEIPKGIVVDHLCRNTLCVNPAHLEGVTQGENTARGISPVGKPGGRNYSRLIKNS